MPRAERAAALAELLGDGTGFVEAVFGVIQRAPDGGEHAFNGKYLEVVAPERISMTFNYEGIPGDHEAVSTLVLTDEGGKTRMSSTMVFKTKEDRDGMVQSGMESGARETDERLAVILEELKQTQQ